MNDNRKPLIHATPSLMRRVRKKKNKKKIHGQFLPLPYIMIDSPAWQSLSSNAIKVYIQLMRKCNGNNDDNLSLTYNEMNGILAPATLRKCLTELVENGFIDLKRQGGLQKQCNIFAKSERWKEYGSDSFEHRSHEKWNYGGFAEMWKKRRERLASQASTKNEAL